MRKIYGFFLLMMVQINHSKAQGFTSFFTGDTSDVTTSTSNRICLMGGRTEDDNAMRWLLAGSGGGDVVVLRSTGSDGYNSYLFSGLGISVNSVQTLVVNSRAGANNAYVVNQVRNAEAIWIAGGDQSQYVSFWKNTGLDSALNYLINVKKVPIGGTSAGMAILGKWYYAAEASSSQSNIVLQNPFHNSITIGKDDFLQNNILTNTITDTHFDNPDRRGRLITFMARLHTETGERTFAIAADEYTAVCIDTNGFAKVYGEAPAYDDNAYFLQSNCNEPTIPETILANQPLTWNRNNAAVKVYRIKGTTTANNSFNLNDWKTGTGGVWFNWWVDNGTLNVDSGVAQANCFPLNTSPKIAKENFRFYPNPANNLVKIILPTASVIEIRAINGKLIRTLNLMEGSHEIDVQNLPNACYLVGNKNLGFQKLFLVKN